jgi:1-acyl-sn-glycerol-3-phosphate acyltransferase
MLGGAVALLDRLGVSYPWLPRLVTWWHRRLGRCLGIGVVYRGVAAPGALLAMNHVSWLDIPMLGGAASVSFVSKAEVRSWPLVGWLAELSGTLFLRRGAHEASNIATQIAARLQTGCRVAIFPEGTTSDGRALLPFHARLFAAASAASEAPVQPVAIRYGWGRQPDAVAPFIGDDSLLAHLTRVLRHPGLGATVSFLPPMTSSGLSRRELAAAVRTAIAAELDHLPQSGDAGQVHRPRPSGAAASA